MPEPDPRIAKQIWVRAILSFGIAGPARFRDLRAKREELRV